MKTLYLLIFLFFLTSPDAWADEFVFSDETLETGIHLPEWFKLSFLDLQDDLDEAIADHKKGIIIYFGRKDCPYCKALLEKNWTRKDIVYYTQKYFDVIAINTKGTRNVTDFDSFVYNEKEYALKMKTNFTPSLLFINNEGKIVFKMAGYHKPYRFMAALEYVAGEHYKSMNFKNYLALAKNAQDMGGGDELNDQPFFESPPFNLNRSQFKAEQPLAVFFEKKNCHACDILHSIPLEDKRIRRYFEDLDVIQVDVDSDQQLITPAGEKTSAIKWSEELALNYSPTIVFFDEAGKEIIRIDSVVWLHRLGRVLQYIQTGGYKKYESFQAWRLASGMKKITAQ